MLTGAQNVSSVLDTWSSNGSHQQANMPLALIIGNAQRLALKKELRHGRNDPRSRSR